MSCGKTLLFVYNTDSGVVPGIRDYAVRTGRPAGKDVCNLSAITHSPVGMKKDWKRYLRELKLPSQFMDRNEFIAEFGPGTTGFPVVLVRQGDAITVMIGTDELNRCSELENLTSFLDQRIPLVLQNTPSDRN